jgi:hypothetical protein
VSVKHNKQKAIAALLTCKTLAEDAKQCKTSQKTLWTWLQDADFQREYQAAQRAVVDGAIAKLQAATDKAVETLIKNLGSPNDFASNAAAQAIISHSLKAREQRDVIDRLARLEALANERGLKKA